MVGLFPANYAAARALPAVWRHGLRWNFPPDRGSDTVHLAEVIGAPAMKLALPRFVRARTGRHTAAIG
jgi:hypothetical protein